MQAERTRLKASAENGKLVVSKASEEVYRRIEHCRACESDALEEILPLGEQYLPRFPEEIDFSLPRAPLTLVRCEGCGLLQLLHSVKPDLLFRDYWYRSGMNQTMRDALSDLVIDALSYHKNGTWLDIGANDGTLLKAVPDDFVKIACEPATAFQEQLVDECKYVIGTYFDGRKVPEKCDVITSAAMFYDVDEPAKFIQGIESTLKPNGIWINQLNDAGLMLKNNAWDGICHEHACYYDLKSLANLYQRNGMRIINVTYNDVNGGSARITAMKDKSGPPFFIPPPPTRADVHLFADRVLKWRTQMLNVLHSIMNRSIWAYAASTKGTVMLQYLGETPIQAVADRNPEKIGRYMVGNWIPIKSEDEMREAKPGYLIPLAWAFKDEFVKREKKLLESGTTMVMPLPNIEFIT